MDLSHWDFSRLIGDSRRDRPISQIDPVVLSREVRRWLRAHPMTVRWLSVGLSDRLTPGSRISKVSAVVRKLSKQGVVRRIGEMAADPQGRPATIWAGQDWFDPKTIAVTGWFNEGRFCVRQFRVNAPEVLQNYLWRKHGKAAMERADAWAEVVLSWLALYQPTAKLTRYTVKPSDLFPDGMIGRDGWMAPVFVHRGPDWSRATIAKLVQKSQRNSSHLLIITSEPSLPVLQRVVGNSKHVYIGAMPQMLVPDCGRIPLWCCGELVLV